MILGWWFSGCGWATHLWHDWRSKEGGGAHQPEGVGAGRPDGSLQDQAAHVTQEAHERLLRSLQDGAVDGAVPLRRPAHLRERHPQGPRHGGRRHYRGVPAADGGVRGGGGLWAASSYLSYHSFQLFCFLILSGRELFLWTGFRYLQTFLMIYLFECFKLLDLVYFSSTFLCVL